MYKTTQNEEILKHLPRVGMVIKTRHLDYFDWNTSIIRNIKSLSSIKLDINFSDDYFQRVVMFDDILSCKSSDKRYVYAFKGIVNDIQVENELIVLDIIEAKRMENLRFHQRYDICCIATSNNFYSIVLNISYEGLSIYTNNSISKGQIIELDIFFSNTNKLKGIFEVKWLNKIDNYFICGLKLINLNEENKDILENNIRKIEYLENQATLKYLGKK